MVSRGATYEKVMQRLIEFYQPFVSAHMDTRFQRGEILFPIIMVVMFAIMGAVPVFWSGHWVLAIVSAIVWAFLLYTLQALMLRNAAERRPDGSLYISPSVASVTRLGILMFSLLLTVAYFLIQASWTGFLVWMNECKC